MSAEQQIEEIISDNLGTQGDGYAITVSGFPGAGKTTAAEIAFDVISEETDENVVQVNLNAELNGEKRQYTTDERLDIVEQIVEENCIESAEYAVIDGILSPEDLMIYSQFFDELDNIYIEAHSLARHNRIYHQDGKDADRDRLIQDDIIAEVNGVEELYDMGIFSVSIENEELTLDEFTTYVKSQCRSLYKRKNN